MYISIKLPPAFGFFNQLRKENYPFNTLFTSYLAEVSRLGSSLGLNVEELVGYIEDRIFEGRRLPDVPDGNEPVDMRYKMDDEDVVAYISENKVTHKITNRMAIMYIARMTMRLSAEYGTSLPRLTRLISDLSAGAGVAKKEKAKPKARPEARQEVKEQAPAPKPQPVEAREEVHEAALPRVSRRAVVQPAEPKPEPKAASVADSVQAARAALSELNELTAQVDAQEGVMETSPYMTDFL